MAVACPVSCTAQAGKFLSFVLDAQEYGLEILKVQEIKGMGGIVRVPGMPEYMRGVINLRGRVVPTIDLRRRFGLPACPDPEHSCLIIVQLASHETEPRVGLIVDAVADVLNLQTEQIEPVMDEKAFAVPSGCLDGHGRIDQRSVALLNIEGVFHGDDLETIVQATA